MIVFVMSRYNSTDKIVESISRRANARRQRSLTPTTTTPTPTTRARRRPATAAVRVSDDKRFFVSCLFVGCVFARFAVLKRGGVRGAAARAKSVVTKVAAATSASSDDAVKLTAAERKTNALTLDVRWWQCVKRVCVRVCVREH